MIAGHCGKCGAPYTLPDVWHGTCDPTPTPSCGCWNRPTTYTGTTIETWRSDTTYERRSGLKDRRKGAKHDPR
jgi:hypothetical protein